MKYLSLLVLAFLLSAPAQTLSDDEQASLQRALGEAGQSPLEVMRALEDHLNRFPNSPRKLELERALVKTAINAKDQARIIKFGERILAAQPDDPELLQQVATGLLLQGEPAGVERALKYAHHLQEIEDGIAKSMNFSKMSGRDAARSKDDLDRNLAAAFVLQSRAEGVLGHIQKAVDLAEASFKQYPNVDAAREAANWLVVQAKPESAIEYLAAAFAISTPQDPQKAQDRARMGELYRKLKGNETGLGDVILQAYDRTTAAFEQRHAEQRKLDPNANIADPMQFTLTSLDGDTLKLSSLLGKVVVMDFWATWCGPCRIQHPLYEQVKEKFKGRDDLVFLAIDADEDHSLVKPFLQANGWNNKVYFDNGLQFNLQVGSIPATLIFDKKGSLVSRMDGFLPDRFVDMLTDRINDALGTPTPKPLQVSAQ